MINMFIHIMAYSDSELCFELYYHSVNRSVPLTFKEKIISTVICLCLLHTFIQQADASNYYFLSMLMWNDVHINLRGRSNDDQH
jgi:hypothetical protein